MSKIKTILRLLLGALFVIFGANFFLQFLPQPTPAPEAQAFLGALFQAGYFFPMVKITEIVVGVLLLANLFVPLALVILAPITINILAVHLFLDPGGLLVGLVVVILNLALGIMYLEHYKPMLKAKVS